jgi:hypothetical protein
VAKIPAGIKGRVRTHLARAKRESLPPFALLNSKGFAKKSDASRYRALKGLELMMARFVFGFNTPIAPCGKCDARLVQRSAEAPFYLLVLD